MLEFFIFRKAFGIGAGGRQIVVAAAVSVVMLGAVLVALGAQSNDRLQGL